MKRLTFAFATLMMISTLPGRANELNPEMTTGSNCQALSGALMKSLSRETKSHADAWWQYIAAGAWLVVEPFSGTAALAYVTIKHVNTKNKRADIEYAIGEVWSNKYSEQDCSLALDAMEDPHGDTTDRKNDKARPMATKGSRYTL